MNARGQDSRGFVITLDAIAALSLLLISLYFIQSATFTPTTLQGTALKQMSLDTMTVLQKSGRLENVFAVNGTSVEEVLLASPPEVCMELSVVAMNGSVAALVEKPGCGEPVSESQVLYGTFSSGGALYGTALQSWYNQEVSG